MKTKTVETKTWDRRRYKMRRNSSDGKWSENVAKFTGHFQKGRNQFKVIVQFLKCPFKMLG